MRHPLLPTLILTATAAAAYASRVEWPPTSTFSIVARDPVTGDLGVAVQSRFLAVGAVVPFAKAGVGAIATQSYANTTYGPRGLELLRKGAVPAEVVRRLTTADKGRNQRQLGVISAAGIAVSYTGSECNAWAGHVTGPNYACQGNILAGDAVVQEMAKAFRTTEGELARRLIAALAAGQAAGGDTRGQQSAAVLVVRAEGGYGGNSDRFIDLRVDDHPMPIEELARVHALWERTFGRGIRAGFAEQWEEAGNKAAAAQERRAILQ